MSIKPPTATQLAYLRTLAERTGRKFISPRNEPRRLPSLHHYIMIAYNST